MSDFPPDAAAPPAPDTAPGPAVVPPGEVPEGECAIRLRGVSKMFRIYASPAHFARDVLARMVFRREGGLHREFWALRDIDLDVPRGITLGIVGANGAGKSTFLQVVSDILQPTTGTVEVNGRVSALLELGAGFSREFTGRENVFLQGAIMGIPRRELERRFAEIEAFADIGDFIDQPVKTYSSGMYVRLAFAVAINVDPDILIIDEALAVGDAMFKRRCYGKIEEFGNRGKTILLVSHSLGIVQSLCDRVVLLDRGRIVEVGAPKDVINSYNRVMVEREEASAGGRGPGAVSAPRRSAADRFGTGEAEVIDVALLGADGAPCAAVVSNRRAVIRVSARFGRAVRRVRLGISITSLSGTEVFGFHTELCESPQISARAGEVLSADFSQVLNLNPGVYAVNAGVDELIDTHTRVLDRRIGIMTFNVVGRTRANGFVDMGTEVRITRGAATGEGPPA